MCGVAGVFERSAVRAAPDLERRVGRMASAIRHRGPDDEGVWSDASSGVALAHRRLSILDLSPEGHQPMRSADGRYVVVFNGEIYNFRALRAELADCGHVFRGHSDTEVLLAAMVQWGFRGALLRLNGMFAIAVWDVVSNGLFLARDRMGEKPLYYGTFGGVTLFASELRALLADPACPREVDPVALALYLRHGYVPAPHSILTGVAKVPPGTSIAVTREGVGEPVPYWSLSNVVIQGAEARGSATLREEDAVDELDALLRDAVKIRMESDVPLGAFLSGGIDSSAVVALMQAQSARPIRTFSLGFTDRALDEAPYARAVAGHLGTSHTELYVRSEDAQMVVPRLAGIYDEPFADASQIPTCLVSALARRHVTVALSGDGGDEVFGGYSRYSRAEALWRTRERVPRPLRSVVRNAAQQLASSWPRARLGQLAHGAAALLGADSREALYLRMMSYWRDVNVVAAGREEVIPLFRDRQAVDETVGFAEWMMYVDTLTYLPDDILVKVDRASMSVALEARVPILDHRVVELAWRWPCSVRRGPVGKRVLRRLLDRYVPRSMVERPKRGFGVPLAAWLRGPLREWAEPLLDESRLRRRGLIDARVVRRRWAEHVRRERDWSTDLWIVLSLEAWLGELPGVGAP